MPKKITKEIKERKASGKIGDSLGERSTATKKANDAISPIEKQKNKLINTMTESIKNSADAVYRKLKLLNKKEHFFVPKPNEDDGGGFFTEVKDVTKAIFEIITELRDGVFSVSTCFTTDDVKNEDTGVVKDGYCIMYTFEVTEGCGQEKEDPKHLPVRTETVKSALGEETIKYIFPKDENDRNKYNNQNDVSEDARVKKPHGGISFSERFIKKIDLTGDNKKDICNVNTYDGKDGYYQLSGKEEIVKAFDDGSKSNSNSNLLRQRSEVLIFPIECKAEKDKNAKAVRAGYLQVTGYEYVEEDGKKKIFRSNNTEETTDTTKTDSQVQQIKESKILCGDNNDDEYILSVLKCYVSYITLANKIEAFKCLDPTIKIEVPETENCTPQLSINYGYKKPKEKKH